MELINWSHKFFIRIAFDFEICVSKAEAPFQYDGMQPWIPKADKMGTDSPSSGAHYTHPKHQKESQHQIYFKRLQNLGGLSGQRRVESRSIYASAADNRIIQSVTSLMNGQKKISKLFLLTAREKNLSAGFLYRKAFEKPPT